MLLYSTKTPKQHNFCGNPENYLDRYIAQPVIAMIIHSIAITNCLCCCRGPALNLNYIPHNVLFPLCDIIFKVVQKCLKYEFEIGLDFS